MIKINKSNAIPAVLVSNESIWRKELLDEIKKHGSYSELPESIKEEVGKRYKHSDIKKQLIPTEDTKCAFCEAIPNESGYVEVEHFLPKSIYPEKTYKWENLLPSCKRCNLKKLSLDTGLYPIVKPDVDNPDDFFSYDNIKMIVKEDALDEEKAERTIDRLKLNQFRLIKPRSELLVNLVQFESDLKEVLQEYSEAVNSNKKSRLISNILESLDQINEFKKENAKYSGFCKHFILNSEVINKAIKITIEI